MKRGEGLRLIAVAIVAAGIAVGVAEATKGGGSNSSKAGTPTGTGASLSLTTTTATSSSPATASSQHGQVKVAGGAAVARSLSEGLLRVVVDSPPTGPYGDQNESIAQGAAVAAEELNGAGGIAHGVHIKLLTQTLDGLSSAALKARLSADAAGVLILPCDTDSEATLAAAGSEFGMLMLAPCNPDPSAGARYPTYWPVGASSSDEASALTTYMTSDNFHRAFILNVSGSFSAELVTSAFRAAASAQGITVAGSASVALGTSNFAGVVQAIESIHPLPAAVFTALPAPAVNRLATSLKSAGVFTTIIGSSVMGTRLTLTSGSGALESATFPSYGFPRESPAASRFAAGYRSDFSHPPVGSFPGLGFESIRLLAAAAGKAHSASPAAIQTALTDGLTLHGVALASRSYAPHGDHNPVGEVGIEKISSGAFLPLLATTPKS